MKLNTNSSHRGGIVVETAIILAIIGLLVAIAIPIYRSRPDASKIGQAERDILSLAQAQERIKAAYGTYVPLQLLDDISIAESIADDSAIDALANEPEDLRLIPSNLSKDSGIEDQKTLADAEDLMSDWSGPYAEAKRVYLPGAGSDFDLMTISAESVRRDYPLDPWGRPYRFYSPIGLIGSDAGEGSDESLNSDTFSDGALTTQDDRFDTYAIVSYGPNGESDSAVDEDDDIIYLFEASPEVAEE